MLRGGWGREVLRHDLAVRIDANRTAASAASSSDDGRELLREWYEFERARAEHAASRPARGEAVGAGAATRLPASQVLVAAWMRGIRQRRDTCGDRHVAEMRAAIEASSERFYATRVAWQRRVAARTCARRCRRAAPLTLAFVGDSHVRNLFAHVASILEPYYETVLMSPYVTPACAGGERTSGKEGKNGGKPLHVDLLYDLYDL